MQLWKLMRVLRSAKKFFKPIFYNKYVSARYHFNVARLYANEAELKNKKLKLLSKKLQEIGRPWQSRLKNEIDFLYLKQNEIRISTQSEDDNVKTLELINERLLELEKDLKAANRRVSSLSRKCSKLLHDCDLLIAKSNKEIDSAGWVMIAESTILLLFWMWCSATLAHALPDLGNRINKDLYIALAQVFPLLLISMYLGGGDVDKPKSHTPIFEIAVKKSLGVVSNIGGTIVCLCVLGSDSAHSTFAFLVLLYFVNLSLLTLLTRIFADL